VTERGDWSEGLIFDCKNSKSRNHRHADDSTENFNKCCARKILSSYEDFKNVKCWLEEAVAEFPNFHLIFLPKFHCELNFIERVWGYIKYVLRRDCTFRFDDLKRMLSETLRSVPLPFIRRAARSAFRWMSAYREGLTGPFLDYVVKKYSSHRCIPKFADEPDLRAAYEKEFECTRRVTTVSGRVVKVEDQLDPALVSRMRLLEKKRSSNLLTTIATPSTTATVTSGSQQSVGVNDGTV